MQKTVCDKSLLFVCFLKYKMSQSSLEQPINKTVFDPLKKYVKLITKHSNNSKQILSYKQCVYENKSKHKDRKLSKNLGFLKSKQQATYHD